MVAHLCLLIQLVLLSRYIPTRGHVGGPLFLEKSVTLKKKLPNHSEIHVLNLHLRGKIFHPITPHPLTPQKYVLVTKTRQLCPPP